MLINSLFWVLRIHVVYTLYRAASGAIATHFSQKLRLRLQRHVFSRNLVSLARSPHCGCTFKLKQFRSTPNNDRLAASSTLEAPCTKPESEMVQLRPREMHTRLSACHPHKANNKTRIMHLEF